MADDILAQQINRNAKHSDRTLAVREALTIRQELAKRRASITADRWRYLRHRDDSDARAEAKRVRCS